MTRVEDAKKLFTRPIESKACHVSVSAIHGALDEWEVDRGYKDLGEALDRNNHYRKGPEYWRVADRMVQKMRRAGLIVPVRGQGWTWVAAPQDT